MSTIPNNKKIIIIGGGTNTYISNHLALSAPAYGTTARILEDKFRKHSENKMQVDLYLTKMADQGKTRESLQESVNFRKEFLLNNPSSEELKKIANGSIKQLEDKLERYLELDTPEDVEALVDKLVADPDTRVIIFNVAMVDYKPTYLSEEVRVRGEWTDQNIRSEGEFGKYSGRLSTSQHPDLNLELSVQNKIINKIRKERKDILLVGFKTTCGVTKEEQFNKGLKLCKDASANIVFVNDVDKERIEKLNQHLKANNDVMSRHYLNQVKIELDNEGNIKKELWKEAKIKNMEAISNLQNNGLVTPEESSYWYNTRDEALDALVQMVLDRSHLHFTRSTVVDSETVPWNIRQHPDHYAFFPNPLIPETFRTVFDWVRSQGAYKQGPTGATVGHFGIKLGPNEFLTSKRKTDFNKIEEVGLVRVITDDPDNVFGYKHFFKKLECEKLGTDGFGFESLETKIKDSYTPRGDKVIAFGAKPSVGGQSQRTLFDTFPDLNCIVHFHCPLKPESRELFNTTKQFSFECGSRECIASNLTGFKEYKVSDTHSIWAGHMDYHGPNIVFNSSINPQLVIDFISSHWDLSKKTSGLSSELV